MLQSCAEGSRIVHRATKKVTTCSGKGEFCLPTKLLALPSPAHRVVGRASCALNAFGLFDRAPRRSRQPPPERLRGCDGSFQRSSGMDHEYRSSMSLPELVELETVIERFGDDARATVLTRVEGFPVWALEIGEGRPEDPCLLLVGGVHGLERIGTKVVLAYLGSLAERLAWDALTREALTRSRIVSIPLLNPVGMRNGTRGNGNGVDLMRNGPSSDALGGTFLVGGHRLSPRLPWFMGDPNEMEPETVALIEFVERVVLSSRSAISLDVHSGFGFQDRIWFPYARKAGPIAHTPEVYCLSALLDTTLPPPCGRRLRALDSNRSTRSRALLVTRQ